jgi:hypothetical protein
MGHVNNDDSIASKNKGLIQDASQKGENQKEPPKGLNSAHLNEATEVAGKAEPLF